MTKNWTYHEGKALISAYGNRKEEYGKTRKKAHFWQNILTDLESLNALVTPTTARQAEVKWQTMYRAYKNAKDRGTGSSPSKFLYLNDMDSILSSNPIISSPHSVTVGSTEEPQSPSETATTEPSLAATNSTDVPKAETARKGKVKRSGQKGYYDMKLKLQSKYNADKLEVRKKINELLEKFLMKKENDRAVRDATLKNILNKLS